MDLARKHLSRDSRMHANVFSCSSAVSDVVNEGEKALVSPICDKPGLGLIALRYQCYFEKRPTKTSHIEPQSLSPPKAADFLPSCIYLQAKQCHEESVGM